MRDVLIAGALAVGGVWASWQFQAPIDTASVSRTQFVRFTLHPQINPADDLRVIDDLGSEVPYVVDPDGHRAVRETERDLPLSDVAFVPGEYTQAIVDLGTEGRLHDAIKIQTKTPTFFVRAGIESSEDRATWGAVRNDAYVYHVANDDNAGNTVVTFTATHARWLRVRLFDPRERFAVDGIASASPPPRGADTFAALPGHPVHDPKSQAPAQTWTATFPQPVAVSAVRFEGASGAFERAVTVEGRGYGQDWHEVARGTISSFKHGTPQTTFAFAEERLPAWRMTIENGSDAPVPGIGPRLLTRPHDVLFEAASGRHYSLLTGNPNAAPPSYDLAAKLEHEDWTAKHVPLGELSRNPAYADSRPFMERFPLTLTGIFLIMAGTLLFVAARTLLKSREAQPPDAGTQS